MIDYILKEFKNILNNTVWMDGPSRQNALAKVNFFSKILIILKQMFTFDFFISKAAFIHSNIGYPDFLLNGTKLDEDYKNVSFEKLF